MKKLKRETNFMLIFAILFTILIIGFKLGEIKTIADMKINNITETEIEMTYNGKNYVYSIYE